MSISLKIQTIQLKQYQVRGNTLAKLERHMNRKGPRDENDGERVWALTTTRIDFADSNATTTTVDEPEVLANGKYRVTVKLKKLGLVHGAEILYPEWKGASKHPSKSVQKEWKRFMYSLMNHEMEHVKQSAEMAEEIREALERSTAEGTGATPAEAKADAEANMGLKLQHTFQKRLRGILDQLHAKLDKRTDHGRRDGARLQTDIT